MTRQGSLGFAFAAALLGLCLSGCAVIGDVSAVGDPMLSHLAERLEADAWTVDPGWSVERAETGDRWRFGDGNTNGSDTASAERLLTLAARGGKAGRNAAILAARGDAKVPPTVLETLERIVANETTAAEAISVGSVTERLRATFNSKPPSEPVVTPNERAAAAEAWCHALASTAESIDAALDRPARLWRRADLPDGVKAELARGLARHIAPERIVGYDALLPGDPTTIHVELRRAAVEGCILFAAAKEEAPFDAGEWPAALENARFDPDASVRRLYGRWLAVAQHPEAIARLEVQQRDSNPTVAIASVRSLGLIRTDEARDVLRKVAAKPAETLRNSAVEALAAWGVDEIKPYLKDESPIVRRTAVTSLGRWESPQAAILLDGVLADADLDVQRRAVKATETWSDDVALPVLLAALQNASVRTRRESLDELRRRTGFEESFPVSAEPAERAAALQSLCVTHGWPTGRLTGFRLATTDAATKVIVPPSEDVLANLTRLDAPDVDTTTRDALLDALRTSESSAVPAIEEFCQTHPGRTADLLASEVLPAISPAHAALKELASEDVAIRRHGAGKLAELGRAATLSPFVLRRLNNVLTREQDGLVWRQCMAAVAADGTAGAERIALMAANNAWPDVRRLGCEYAGRHCRTGHAAWLLPLLTDGNDAVRLAAIDAAGRCANSVAIGNESGPAGSPTGLRAAAADPNRTIRFAALIALARLGDESGSLGLLRWAEYESPAERTKAIRAIGDTGRRRFESDLMRLAWTERDESVRRELLTALETLVPAAQRPVGALATSAEDRLAAWAARWEARSASSTISAAPAGS
ncbi:MAG: HEAT repeat domain-containing protein [Planctomycetota bacterium]|nr:HEAT repeat domain-containing protein [Planctomycetota bacterium]